MRAKPLCVFLLVACIAVPAMGQSWKFIAVGDTRSDGANDGVNVTIVAELATAIVNEGAEFVLVPGDLANSGGVAAAFPRWKSTMQPVYNAGIGVYPIRGNHDVESSGYWDAAFAADLPDNGPAGELNRTYSFTYNNALIIGMDQYINTHRNNQTWLDQQLAANAQPHVFVFGHDPAFKYNHSDCLDDYPTNRNAFWNSIAAAGGRTYFCGHDHLLEHARIDDGDGDPSDDLHQYIVGTGGAPFHTSGAYNGTNSPFTPIPVYHEANYGYVLVEINGYDATLTWKHRTAANVYTATTDVFTYSVAPPPPTIARSPASFTHTIPFEGNQANDTFTVWNSGGGTLDYTITDNGASWFDVDPLAGTSTGEPSTFTVTYLTVGLAPGTYDGTITISDPGAVPPEATIAVRLIVQPPEYVGDFDDDLDVDLGDFSFFQACFNGPNRPYALPGSCTVADLDSDQDIDLTDFARFQACFNGPNRPAQDGCRI